MKNTEVPALTSEEHLDLTERLLREHFRRSGEKELVFSLLFGLLKCLLATLRLQSEVIFRAVRK